MVAIQASAHSKMMALKEQKDSDPGRKLEKKIEGLSIERPTLMIYLAEQSPHTDTTIDLEISPNFPGDQ